MPLRAFRLLPLLLAIAAAAPAAAQPRQVGSFMVTSGTDPQSGVDASVAAVTEMAAPPEPAALVWACHGPALRTAFAFPGSWLSTKAFLSWRFDADPTESREVEVQPVEGALAVVLPPEMAAAITARARDARALLVSLETDEGRQLHGFDLAGAAEALSSLACSAPVAAPAAGAARRSLSDRPEVEPRLLNEAEVMAEAMRALPEPLRNRRAQVRVMMQVGADGRPQPDAIVLLGDPQFVQAAQQAALLARFTPGTTRGMAVPAWVELPISFPVRPPSP